MPTFTHSLNAAQLQALSDTVVFDCRHDLTAPTSGAAQYAESHIASAYFAGLDTHLSGAKTGTNGRHPLPERHALIAWLASCGVTPESQVVCYDALDGMFAARLWWLCRWAGLKHVAVLTGGFAGWLAAGGAVSPHPPERLSQALSWQARPLENVMLANELLDLLHAPERLLIDARAPERYRGEVEPMDPVAGHIPGAKNRFFKRNVTARGDFTQDLALQWQHTLGTYAPTAVIHTCGSGATACHNILALHVAGLLQADQASTLYAGSWSEWCAHPQRPVTKG
jgi:thiosulfate/3-mercaptopyruvate sulfurtransferase